MSLGYATKLSYKEDVGTVGMSEMFDSPQLLHKKIEDLAMMIQKSKHLVAFTGAGISTSSGIPDFRGPTGIWTLQREGKAIPQASLPFHRAMPSFTHMALVELEKAGILKFVISQNIDNLHLRSGIPRAKLAELHGNSFREICSKCRAEYIRDFEIETIGMKETPRHCSVKRCGRTLRDTVLDWEDALLPEEMGPAENNCKMADIVLCLGTSLQITPACNLPCKATKGGGRFVIVNLQPTPKDKKAELVIHAKVDKVIAGVMHLLNLRIPPYVRVDPLQLIISRSSKRGRSVDWTISITNVDGNMEPLPFLRSVEVKFAGEINTDSTSLCNQPFCLTRETEKASLCRVLLQLNFVDGCGCSFIKIDHEVHLHTSGRSKRVNHNKDTVYSQLRNAAIGDSSCGQHAQICRSVSSDSCTETTIYAVVTSISRHDQSPLLEEARIPETNGNATANTSAHDVMKENKVNVKRGAEELHPSWHDGVGCVVKKSRTKLQQKGTSVLNDQQKDLKLDGLLENDLKDTEIYRARGGKIDVKGAKREGSDIFEEMTDEKQKVSLIGSLRAI